MPHIKNQIQESREFGVLIMTVVVFDKETKEIIACIPIADANEGICRKDVDFRIYNETEPVFTETENGVKLNTSAFVINI